jgi:hypothetical protein
VQRAEHGFSQDRSPLGVNRNDGGEKDQLRRLSARVQGGRGSRCRWSGAGRSCNQSRDDPEVAQDGEPDRPDLLDFNQILCEYTQLDLISAYPKDPVS